MKCCSETTLSHPHDTESLVTGTGKWCLSSRPETPGRDDRTLAARQAARQAHVPWVSDRTELDSTASPRRQSTGARDVLVAENILLSERLRSSLGEVASLRAVVQKIEAEQQAATRASTSECDMLKKDIGFLKKELSRVQEAAAKREKELEGQIATYLSQLEQKSLECNDTVSQLNEERERVCLLTVKALSDATCKTHGRIERD
mmetsp:Transcript_1432/g.2369  ORF Transcript_1432/g.2369 Transcript_1432/m.2369 type:complete len:204 (+) Transcript_1432:202-813(+)